MAKAAFLVACYLLGSLPFGLLIAGIKGIDLRKTGSGNIGATNVLRSAGKLAALFTVLGDSLKGAAVIGIARFLGLGPAWQAMAGFCAVLGHNFSIFLKLKGGKGVATSLGVITALSPLSGVFAVAVWLLVAFLTRYSSLAALLSFAVLPAASFFLGASKIAVLTATALAILIIVRHTGNIKRLIGGDERRIGEKA
ncbi:MAG: glycerol-3-phosphate 1-O-acyltransferase PlsY [Nitrospiraceae bacterium]|nr:glycerol-3-phosphate 1-O-acyltransferase PlsY [Nitrospiraceae bacterium]